MGQTAARGVDRKSTRLNSSHMSISYAVFCSKKKKLPLLYLIEDNGYAISVPVEVQTAGGNISKLVREVPGLHVSECDGTDPFESFFFNDTATTEIYTLSLHDALPI